MGNRPGSFIDKLKNHIQRKHSTSKSSHEKIESTPLETFLLVWLDPHVDTSKENIRTQKRLRKILTCLITFDNVDECRRWLEKCSNDEKIVLIVSGAYGEEIVPRIHDLSCIISIYVYCLDVQRNQSWSKDFRKIRSVQSKTDVLIDELAHHQINLENFEDSKALQIYKQEEIIHSWEKKTASLIWYQLILEILIQSNYLPRKGTYDEFIEILRQYNSNDEDGSKLIDEFERTYDSKQAVSWLARDTPLIRFVSKALREQDINILFTLRFLLVDIHNQIQQKQAPSLNVFRLQLMSKSHIKDFKASRGQFIVIHSFLFATTKKSELLSTMKANDQFETVLLEIEAEFRSDTASFAFLQQLDSYNEEQIEREVIFMCGAIFEVGPLVYENLVWRVPLKLASEHDIPVLFQMKQKLKETRNLNMISDLLKKSNEEERANIFSQRILKEQSQTQVTTIQTSRQTSKHDSALNSNKLISANNVAIILVNLFIYFNESTSAILKVLSSFGSKLLIILNDQTTMNFSSLSKKQVLLFTTAQFAFSVKNFPKHFQIFVFDPENKTNGKQRFSTIDDLMHRLVDEMIELYRLEISKYLKSGEIDKAKEYNQQINGIYRQLKTILNISTMNPSSPSILINHEPVLIWLRSTNSSSTDDDKIIDFIEESLKDYLPLSLQFFHESEFHEYIATENPTNLFLIVSSNYSEIIRKSLQQFSNVKYFYSYGKSTENNRETIQNRDDLCYQLMSDLLEYCEEFAEQYRIHKRNRQAREMLVKAQELCQLLSKNYFSSK